MQATAAKLYHLDCVCMLNSAGDHDLHHNLLFEWVDRFRLSRVIAFGSSFLCIVEGPRRYSNG
jgi:hypothetical protein